MSKRSTNNPIRVLLVEDSRSQRELLIGLLEKHGFVVVGTATNGQEAINATQQHKPEVIAMDINLPVLDGFQATMQIMQRCPTPIVMISNQKGDEDRSIRALAAGALAVVRKPLSLRDKGDDSEQAIFLTTLRLMADVKVVTRFPVRQPPISSGTQPGASAPAASKLPAQTPASSAAPQLLAVASSTGGPAALQMLLGELGADFTLPVLIAQHITRGFVTSLADWLNSVIPLKVKIAEHHERLLPGHVYLAPDDQHLLAGNRGVVVLQQLKPGDRFCPSADLLFDSVAKAYGARAIGVVLTGMGSDGSIGLKHLYGTGAQTLAQDQASCVVYGMPQAAVANGAVGHVGPIATLANTIKYLTAQNANRSVP